MKSTARALGTTALIAAALFGGMAAAQDDRPQIIVVTHGQGVDGFWSVVKNGVDRAAADMDADVDYRAPETFDMVAMAQLIDAAVTQAPDGLVVSIPDADALGPSIARAVAAGIPVISMNSGAEISRQLGALLHVGQGEYDAGKAAGAKLAELGAKKGLCVNGEVGNVALDQRCQGFADGFGQAVETLPVSFDLTDSTARVVAALSADPAIDAILATDAQAAGGAVLAGMDQVGRSGDIRFAAFDMNPDLLKAIEEDRASFAIDQQQYLQGYLPVVFLALNARFGLMPGGDVPSGPNLITKDKAAQVVELSAIGIR